MGSVEERFDHRLQNATGRSDIGIVGDAQKHVHCKDNADVHGAERSWRVWCSRPPTQNRCVGKREVGNVHVEEEEANLDSVGGKHHRLPIPTKRYKNCKGERIQVSKISVHRISLSSRIRRSRTPSVTRKWMACQGTLFRATGVALKRIAPLAAFYPAVHFGDPD